MTKVDVRVSGDVEVSRKMRRILKALDRNGIEDAMIPGAKIVRAEAARRAPATRIVIALRVKKGRLTRVPNVSVTVSYQAAALAAWFEKGTRARFHKSGKYVGHLNRRPFLGPALESTQNKVRNSFTREVRRKILRAVSG